MPTSALVFLQKLTSMINVVTFHALIGVLIYLYSRTITHHASRYRIIVQLCFSFESNTSHTGLSIIWEFPPSVCKKIVAPLAPSNHPLRI